MDNIDVKTNNDKDRILTRKNYNNWITKAACEFSNKLGMEMLIMNGIEKAFLVVRPEYRIPAVVGFTPVNRVRDGFIVGEDGIFLELDPRVQRSVDREHESKLRKNDRDQGIYEAAKRGNQIHEHQR